VYGHRTPGARTVPLENKHRTTSIPGALHASGSIAPPRNSSPQSRPPSPLRWSRDHVCSDQNNRHRSAWTVARPGHARHARPCRPAGGANSDFPPLSVKRTAAWRQAWTGSWHHSQHPAGPSSCRLHASVAVFAARNVHQLISTGLALVCDTLAELHDQRHAADYVHRHLVRSFVARGSGVVWPRVLLPCVSTSLRQAS
jgi:hypothetical protein